MDISWHENCLTNQQNTNLRERNDLLRKMRLLEISEKSSNFYEMQIQTAKNRKKDGFDRDRFLLTGKGKAEWL